MPKTTPILIAGGGIGGLAAAVALAREGVQSIVLEQARELGEIGAGIQIGPNAFHCFDALGIGPELQEAAVFIDALRLMDASTGNNIAEVALGDEFRQRMGNPYAVVHRSDLHAALLNAAGASDCVEVRTGWTLASFEQTADKVIVTNAEGEQVDGAALIGADGLRSQVRAQIVGDGPPRVSGHTTYRSVIPTEQMPEDLRWNAATLWAGPKCHIVHYPLKGWKVFNLVVTYHRDVAEPVSGRPVDKYEVRQGFEHIAPRARQIIEHGEDWRLWVLCDRDPIDNWTDGRVTLLGDAAHPMLQYFAQGACMALEDGVCLGQMIATQDHIPEALHAYQARRLTRTARVQMNSRLIGDHIYHPGGPAAAVRDEVMARMTPSDWYDRLAWIYAHREG